MTTSKDRRKLFVIVTVILCVLRFTFTGAIAFAATEADANIQWYDCQTLGVEGKGWSDTKSFYDRLPPSAEDKVSPTVWGLSHDSAGLCVRFTTDAPSIQVRWMLLKEQLASPCMPATGVSGVDLYAKNPDGRWRFVGNGRPASVSNASTFTTPGGDREYLLYLPLYNGVKSLEIGIPKGHALSAVKAAAARKPLVFYGTSITQGGCASRPGMAFTAIVGRQLDRPIINLGFSASGTMGLEMADLLVELDPAMYVLDCIWNMSPQMVAERVEPFVRRLRQARPNAPILLAEDSSFLNVCPTEKGHILRTAYEKLKTEGVQHLYLLSSQGMLGVDSEGTVDGCHPNDLGMMRQANVFIDVLCPILHQLEEDKNDRKIPVHKQ